MRRPDSGSPHPQLLPDSFRGVLLWRMVRLRLPLQPQHSHRAVAGKWPISRDVLADFKRFLGRFQEIFSEIENFEPGRDLQSGHPTNFGKKSEERAL